ncbi:lytic transglycosylase domain-containing protein [Alphaproteobacteria bacterium]|nr:lytic transglycosylase domain-containing protein [Alphaproteobacteria bacterium]
MKLVLTIIIILSASFANAKTYNRPYIKMLLIENARLSEYVTPALAIAVAKVESDLRPDAVSNKGAIGVMQIMPRTGLLEFGVKRKDLFNPIINVKIGVKFLDQLIKKYKGNIGVALSHYNGGSAVGVWPNVKIIPATYHYVVKVLKKSNELSNKAPSLRKQKNLIQAKFNLIQVKEKSEIDLLVTKIDDWLEIYNNYKKNNVN